MFLRGIFPLPAQGAIDSMLSGIFGGVVSPSSKKARCRISGSAHRRPRFPDCFPVCLGNFPASAVDCSRFPIFAECLARLCDNPYAGGLRPPAYGRFRFPTGTICVLEAAEEEGAAVEAPTSAAAGEVAAACASRGGDDGGGVRDRHASCVLPVRPWRRRRMRLLRRLRRVSSCSWCGSFLCLWLCVRG